MDIYNPGPVGLMFHLKVGNMSIVLGDYKIVNPAGRSPIYASIAGISDSLTFDAHTQCVVMATARGE